MNDFQKKEYIAYYLGNSNIKCHIDAVHSENPRGEINTKELVIEIVKKTDCCGIYSLISRKEMDLNRSLNRTNEPVILEFRDLIFSILQHLQILDVNNKLIAPYLQLALHGMKNVPDKEIEIGTRYNQTCSEDLFIWFRKNLEVHCKNVFNRNLKIAYNEYFIGNESKVVHREKYENLFNTIQIEINKTLRTKYFYKIVEVLTRIVMDFKSYS